MMKETIGTLSLINPHSDRHFDNSSDVGNFPINLETIRLFVTHLGINRIIPIGKIVYHTSIIRLDLAYICDLLLGFQKCPIKFHFLTHYSQLCTVTFSQYKYHLDILNLAIFLIDLHYDWS